MYWKTPHTVVTLSFSALFLLSCGENAPTSPLTTQALVKSADETRDKTFIYESYESIQTPMAECVPGEVVVLPKSKISMNQIGAFQQLQVRGQLANVKKALTGASKTQNSLGKRLDRFTHIKTSLDRVKTQQLIDELNADDDVELAECVGIRTIHAPTNDPELVNGNLWGINRIGSPTAWDTNQGEDVVVAVLDTGIDRNHEDLAANMWSNPNEIIGNGIDDDGNGVIDDEWGWNFISNNANPDDDQSHGTHVAGTIAAVGDNGLGVVGVAPKAKLMAVKVLNAGGTGTDPSIAAGIRYAADSGAAVMNLSLGGFGNSSMMCSAVAYARDKGVLVVVAAGNSAANAANFTPANCNGSFTVSAMRPDDGLAGFSNFGNIIDVTAPGVSILSTRFGGGYFSTQGTSMAAPHVAGIGALVRSVNPPLGVETVENIIKDTAEDIGTPGFDTSFGHGLIDTVAAITFAGSDDLTLPSLSIDPDTEVINVDAGDLVEFNVSGTSPNNAEITFSIDALPSGATFDSTTGAFSFQTDLNTSSQIELNISANTVTGSAEKLITLNVLGGVVAPDPNDAKLGTTGNTTNFVESGIGLGCQSGNGKWLIEALILLLLTQAFLWFHKTKHLHKENTDERIG